MNAASLLRPVLYLGTWGQGGSPEVPESGAHVGKQEWITEFKLHFSGWDRRGDSGDCR